MAMAHSVEGRFPFLDHRLVAWCNRLPSRFKLRGLAGKYLLTKLAEPWLPEQIWQRPKRAYRAPIRRSFFNEGTKDYLDDVLAPKEIRLAGIFNPDAVNQLVARARRGEAISETSDMALAGIISTQLVYRQFVAGFSRSTPLGATDDVKVCVGSTNAST